MPLCTIWQAQCWGYTGAMVASKGQGGGRTETTNLSASSLSAKTGRVCIQIKANQRNRVVLAHRQQNLLVCGFYFIFCI